MFNLANCYCNYYLPFNYVLCKFVQLLCFTYLTLFFTIPTVEPYSLNHQLDRDRAAV